MLRENFYRTLLRFNPNKLRIVTTISAAVYKGYDMILKTAKILKNIGKTDFEWLVFGNISPNFYEKSLGVKHEDVNVKLCGVATPEVLIETFLKCTLYFHPSYIDNSPNSICEAQICGCPVVACSVGGVDSLVSHGLSGFLVPANDPYMAASRILQLYRDRDLNECMGLASKQIASERHNRDSIVNGLLDVYNMIIENK
jgi:glycosyltransferase involved in cell wall biosynthesis